MAETNSKTDGYVQRPFPFLGLLATTSHPQPMYDTKNRTRLLVLVLGEVDRVEGVWQAQLLQGDQDAPSARGGWNRNQDRKARSS